MVHVIATAAVCLVIAVAAVLHYSMVQCICSSCTNTLLLIHSRCIAIATHIKFLSAIYRNQDKIMALVTEVVTPISTSLCLIMAVPCMGSQPLTVQTYSHSYCGDISPHSNQLRSANRAKKSAMYSEEQWKATPIFTVQC